MNLSDHPTAPSHATTWQPPGLMHLGPRPPAVFVRGQGSWLWDATGRRHLDLVQGWAVNSLGHAPPAIAQAVARQAGRLLQAGPGFYNDQAITLAQRLCTLTGMDRVFIGTSGAEANECAIKLARKFGQLHRGGASTILSFDNSFHGRSLATMAASGKPGFDRIFAPALPGFKKAPLNQIDALREALTPDVVAVMVEPIQGEAGVVEAEPVFLQQLRQVCTERGVLLIADEVQCGIGRCGSLLGLSQAGITADIVTLGKGLGGGVPIGAVLAREAVCCFAPGDQGGTYHGNALACAAALAVLDAVSAPGFLAQVQQRGTQLAQGLQGLSARHGLGTVHGRGLLRALALPSGWSSAQVAESARLGQPGGDGLLINPAQPQRLRCMPALNISATEIDHALDLLDAALHAVRATAR
jgi:acetylornithine/N-succinyldiaminopimelate aminotransferase